VEPQILLKTPHTKPMGVAAEFKRLLLSINPVANNADLNHLETSSLYKKKPWIYFKKLKSMAPSFYPVE
jgi:hypothetical protein